MAQSTMVQSDFDDQLDDYFEGMMTVWSQCASRLGESSMDLRIGGKRVRLRFAGQNLMSFVRPLAHLIVASDSSGAENQSGNVTKPGGDLDDSVALEIRIGEGKSAQLRPPAASWMMDRKDLPPGSHEFESWRCERGKVKINHLPRSSSISLFNCDQRTACYWIDDPAEIPFYEIASPFRTILSWWADTIGAQIAHAAVVGKEGRGVLLVGRGGSGKSTTAMACVDAGLQYVSDDYVWLQMNPQPTAYCLYNSAKLHTKLLPEHFPDWQRQVALEVGPLAKSVFFLHESAPDLVTKHLAICGVLSPKITDRKQSVCLPTSRAEVLMGLGPSTLLPRRSGESNGFAFLAQWVRELPAYRLELGGIPTSPAALDAVLQNRAVHVD
ncbi:hypothetical protein SAMN06265222_109196 [Neorhodopirellula lusitana]|uniref:HPr kinase n=1 Tax=Neorhodopirellula lusitana TaxID=445327 RepID=A0ABY1QEJ1_9BACT|nr:hypothetical protein [Neorhodopirellula lusitana]SMP66114.1 hypothetical protein SAMN06265222_109196 [Neorhodopirellula lusitana]